MAKPINILAIESSCDDTAAAVIQDGVLLSNRVATQDMHVATGGIVPEVASRAHLQQIEPVVRAAIDNSGLDVRDLSAVAFTQSPGLIGSLMVGATFAKGLSLSLDIPLIAVHHMEAHVLANFIDEPRPDYPFLCLTVSGGHTQIVVMHSALDMEVIGKTLDDAAGEAFDKTGKLLGLPYPAGPQIDCLAQQGEAFFSFTEPQIDALDFSFSGLKTQVLQFVQRELRKDEDFIEKQLNHICASVQDRIVSILLNKLELAAQQTGITQVALAGGVAGNSQLRRDFHSLAEKHQWTTFIPAMKYCTDNAAMIAMTAHYLYLESRFADLSVTPSPR